MNVLSMFNDRTADPGGALMRLQQASMAQPGDAVFTILTRLVTDRPYLIGAVVQNNPAAVKERYQQFTDRQIAVGKLRDALLAMEAQGKRDMVDRIIAVPYLPGNGGPLDQAFLWLKGEVQSRTADPNDAGMMNVLRTQAWTDDMVGPPPPPDSTGTSTTGNEGNSFDWTAVLNTLPGLVAAFTGAGGAAPGGTAPTTTTAPPKDNTALYITIGVVALIGLTLFLMLRKP